MPLSGDTGLREQAQSGSTVSVVALKWDGAGGTPNPGLPDLLSQWNLSGGLLSYALQVKTAINYQGGKGSYYMVGLSFRLNTNNNTNPDDDKLYGVSYFKSLPPSADTSQTPAWVKSSTFTPIRDGFVYAILWMHNSDGSFTLLDYSLLGFAKWHKQTTYIVGDTVIPTTPNGYYYKCTAVGSQGGKSSNNEPTWGTTVGGATSDGGGSHSITWTNMGTVDNQANSGIVTASGTLVDWSALAVQVDEKYCSNSNDTNCNNGTYRRNFITVYTASPDSSAPPAPYPRGTISWNYSSYFKSVKWSGHISGQQLASGSWSNPPAVETVLDSTFTSANFDTIKPVEIGIHGYYDSYSNNDMYFDDFALKLPSNAIAGSYMQYY